MIQLLGILGIFALVIILFILILVLRFEFGGLRMFRYIYDGKSQNPSGSRWAGGRGGNGNPFDSWHYTYSSGGRSKHRGQTDKQTVHDHRSPNAAQRKIFGKNDGEYVDYEEVK